MSKFLESNKEFLHSVDTIPLIIYEDDVRCARTEDGIRFVTTPHKTFDVDQIVLESSHLEPGTEFVFNPGFDPKVMPGLGIVAGNLYGMPWEDKTLELLISQPGVLGVRFQGKESYIEYIKGDPSPKITKSGVKVCAT